MNFRELALPPPHPPLASFHGSALMLVKLAAKFAPRHSCYLENYLWPNFSSGTHEVGGESRFAHLMSIILMMNEKFREGVAPWESMFGRDSAGTSDKFAALFDEVLQLHESRARPLSMHERASYTLFLINCFQSLEQRSVRQAALRLLSLPLWEALSPGRRQLELTAFPQLRRHWQHLQAKRAAADPMPMPAPANDGHKRVRPSEPAATASAATPRFESTFIPSIVQHFLQVIEAIPSGGVADAVSRCDGLMLYLERFVELLIDLLSQLPTRRFLRALLLDMQVLERCDLSALGSTSGEVHGKLFRQLLDSFRFYLGFEINDQTGQPLSRTDMTGAHHSRLHILQVRLRQQMHGNHDWRAGSRVGAGMTVLPEPSHDFCSVSACMRIAASGIPALSRDAERARFCEHSSHRST